MPMLSRFLCEKDVFRKMSAQGFKDEPFRLEIRIGDQVRFALVGDLSDAAEEVFQEGSGFKCNLARNRQLVFVGHDGFAPFFSLGYHDENRLTRNSIGINK